MARRKGNNGCGREGERQRVATLARRIVGQQGKEEVEVAVVAKGGALYEILEKVGVDVLGYVGADAVRDVVVVEDAG